MASHKWLHFKVLGFFPSFEPEDCKLVYQEANFKKLMGPQDDLNTRKSSQRTGICEKDIIA